MLLTLFDALNRKKYSAANQAEDNIGHCHKEQNAPFETLRNRVINEFARGTCLDCGRYYKQRTNCNPQHERKIAANHEDLLIHDL